MKWQLLTITAAAATTVTATATATGRGIYVHDNNNSNNYCSYKYNSNNNSSRNRVIRTTATLLKPSTTGCLFCCIIPPRRTSVARSVSYLSSALLSSALSLSSSSSSPRYSYSFALFSSSRIRQRNSSSRNIHICSTSERYNSGAAGGSFVRGRFHIITAGTNTAAVANFSVSCSLSSSSEEQQQSLSLLSSTFSSVHKMKTRILSSDTNLTYREMQKMCKDYALPANGTKEAIRKRLLEYLNELDSTVVGDENCKGDGITETVLSVSKTEILFKGSTDDGEQEPSIIGGNVISTPPPSVRKSKRNSSKRKNHEKDNHHTATPPPGVLVSTSSSSSSLPSSSSRKKQRIEPGSLEPPKNWEIVYSIVEELRADRTAPLDTDGGEAVPERHLGEKVYRFQVMVALMLSSQTKDAVVGETMRILQKHGLTVENIHNTDAKVLNGLIQKVGFHNNKTKYLKQVAEVLIRDHDSDIPPTAHEMMQLPGIGPKMAYIIENVAFGRSSGIGVDTHMHRIFNDLKWVQSKTPEQTREQLEGWLPMEKWSEVNMLWVGFGQESQQQKEKILKKAIHSSRPVEALKLLQKVGVDVAKEAKKYGLETELEKVYNNLL